MHLGGRPIRPNQALELGSPHQRNVRADVAEVGIQQRSAQPALIAEGKPRPIVELDREPIPTRVLARPGSAGRAGQNETSMQRR